MILQDTRTRKVVVTLNNGTRVLKGTLVRARIPVWQELGPYFNIWYPEVWATATGASGMGYPWWVPLLKLGGKKKVWPVLM